MRFLYPAAASAGTDKSSAAEHKFFCCFHYRQETEKRENSNSVNVVRKC